MNDEWINFAFCEVWCSRCGQAVFSLGVAFEKSATPFAAMLAGRNCQY